MFHIRKGCNKLCNKFPQHKKRVQPAGLEKRANQRDSLAISQNDKAGGNSEYVEGDETG